MRGNCCPQTLRMPGPAENDIVGVAKPRHAGGVQLPATGNVQSCTQACSKSSCHSGLTVPVATGSCEPTTQGLQLRQVKCSQVLRKPSSNDLLRARFLRLAKHEAFVGFRISSSPRPAAAADLGPRGPESQPPDRPHRSSCTVLPVLSQPLVRSQSRDLARPTTKQIGPKQLVQKASAPV